MQTFHCMNFYIVIFVSFFNPLAYIHTGPFFCSNMGEGLRTMKSQDGIEKIIVFDCCKLVTAQETNKLDKEISSASYILCYCCWLLAISNLTSNSFFFLPLFRNVTFTLNKMFQTFSFFILWKFYSFPFECPGLFGYKTIREM